MANGLVNLQAELRAIEDDGALPFRTFFSFVQRDAFFGDAWRVANEVDFLDQFVTAQHVLAAEAIWIGTLLNFFSRETCGDNSCARLHFHLMNGGADAGDEELFDAAE